MFRLKTGNNPPDDLPFEENSSKTGARFGTLGKKKSKLKIQEQKENSQPFPRKRQIEENIELIEFEIEKGNNTKTNNNQVWFSL